MRWRTLLTLVAMLAGPSVAQTGQTGREGETITVTGKRIPKDEARALAKGFVRAVAAIPVAGQYARWKSPLCVKVNGLSDANAAIVAGRIRTLATEIGVKLAKDKCKSNLLVVFSDDGPGLVQTIAVKSIRIFGQTSVADRALLRDGQMPVRWWYVTAVEGIDGHQSTSMPAALLGATNAGNDGDTSLSGGMVSNGETTAIDGYRSSLIGTRVRAKIESATVVVDVNRATGRSLNAVASYVGMVALARVRLGTAVTDSSSILSLFETSDAPPRDLSDNDRAFLTALYRTPPNRDARVQEAAIIAEMVRVMTGG